MSLKKLGQSVLDNLGVRSKEKPESETASQHATHDQVQDEAKDGAQDGAQDRAQDQAQGQGLDPAEVLDYLEEIMRKVVSPLEVRSTEQVATVLNVLQDRNTCDVILVCSVLRSFGYYGEDEIVELVKARDSHRYSSFDLSCVNAILELTRWGSSFEARYCPLPEIHAAASQRKRWKKVESNFRAHGAVVDKGDQEAKSAYDIWMEAKMTILRRTRWQ